MLIFGMTIASALFSNSQAKLFPWLFGQPQRVYHLNELRRLSGLGSASLQRELNRLVEAGLVDARTVGNLRQFQANALAPVFDELVAITHKTLGGCSAASAAWMMGTTPSVLWVMATSSSNTGASALA